MRDILSETQIELLANRGLICVNIPFGANYGDNSVYHGAAPLEAQKALNMFAIAYLRAHYNLNWIGNALVIGFEVTTNNIRIKLMNSEMLQLVLLESGLGNTIYNEISKIPSETIH